MRYDDEHEDDDRLDGWVESTEGDLDPDLTEEAGYSGWDPPERRDRTFLWQIIAAVALAALVLPVVLQAFR